MDDAVTLKINIDIVTLYDLLCQVRATWYQVYTTQWTNLEILPLLQRWPVLGTASHKV